MKEVNTDHIFIQRAIEHEKKLHHIGMTHKLLGIQEQYNLAHAKTLLERIVETPIGNTFKNPLVVGRDYYKVTRELKRHANFALNLIRISENRKK